MSGAVLICAATRWEHAPLERRLAARATLLKTGMGARNAGRALAGLEGPSRFQLVISSGFAGALQPGMRTGDIVADLQGAPIEILEAARQAALERKTAVHYGKICHSDAVLGPQEKAALGRERRAGAADMESRAIGQWAEGRGISFLAIRVVLDEVGDRLPPLPPSGEGIRDLAGYVFGNPAAWPLMVVTGFKQRKAVKSLADFLETFLSSL